MRKAEARAGKPPHPPFGPTPHTGFPPLPEGRMQ
jgi:hypothetical protein